MRKSNWVIIAILVVASILFLILWYALGFNLVDDPLDLIITIIWWVVVIVICAIICVVEDRRKRAIRTSFIASDLIYNPEVGIVKVESEGDYVPTLQKVLNSLSYSFGDRDLKNDKRIRFEYIVRSDKFSNGGDTWTGEVVKVSKPDNVLRFNNKRELAQIID